MYTRKRVTITHVAREAGVSTQTVSRVINDRPDVAPETRRRVERVIARLGYRPSAIARSLIRQRSHTLGVVATGLEYYGPSHTLVGIEKQTRALGYSLLLDLLHHPETEDVERIINRMLSRQVDGILWAVPQIGNNRAWLRHNLLHLQAPVVFLSMESRPGLDIVSIDNYRGGSLATEHLLGQGYRRIGIITGPLNWWESRERQRGWQEALQAAGHPVEPRQMVEGNWSSDSGKRGLRQLIEQYPEIEAVYVCNDQMALGALQATHELNWLVPQKLAIVGFDNIPESAYFWPALTTIEQPLIELGCEAVKTLVEIIDSESIGEAGGGRDSLPLMPKLIVRNSSARQPVTR
ncbi:MAG TPA: LacI family DNA-binding transcriptional regulator [Anaerolineales bacterium]|nr:LacI family DNA-binding transcriptional regulator [Anaerolineales bacterium]